ncbi:hypothetical protein [Desulfovibrio piger]|uniref:Uncharacterized protein n=1 Tax=Desulfovibrio piger ATCC 29098 TaxID=411464 RepID=B6WU88_9BACT|nr:hypothetical protein [Desulfovibrio piger]EEB33463.1 hypothetical protein DESPIG_01646 [Desulfovibrio piger ATCC 29098]
MESGRRVAAYQKAWLGDKSPVKVVEKSRRIGLTWAQALDDVLKASTSGRDGMDVLYISFNQDMTRDISTPVRNGRKSCKSWPGR